MRVPVQDEIGPVLGDRDRQAFRAEEDLDPLGLTFERVHCRRVVEQHDAEVAGADLLETVRERLDLGGRLGVDLAELRLAEVGQRGAEEAAAESLRADDSEPAGGPITDGTIERADVLEVVALRIHTASLEDVMTQKLLALTEQEPDYGSVLELARALREQIDWTIVRKRTASSPFAKGFFTLVEALGVVEAAAASS